MQECFQNKAAAYFKRHYADGSTRPGRIVNDSALDPESET